MRSLSALCCLFILLATAQAWAQGASLSGIIKNYNSQSLYLYSFYQDTLLLADSTLTGENGEFTFPSTAFETEQGMPEAPGMYKVVLQRNQFFYILHDGAPMEIQTVYFASPFYNIATDSLVVVEPSSAGLFYEFQRLQRQLNIADHWLLQMMRLYPLPDPFHIEIEQEYFKRYEAMDSFIQTEVESDSLAMLVAKAFYLPVNPDWKQPDPWRDSIIAFHYFDHFDPAIDFYRYTNILSEKMHIYVKMRVNKKDSYGQPVMDEKLYSGAAIDFVNETAGNTRTYQYCLNYFLKKLDKDHKDVAFLHLYDAQLKVEGPDCGLADGEEDVFSWAREKVSVLRGVHVGSTAPNFELIAGELNLHNVKSDYTLVVFWATWCPHCTKVLPELKKVMDDISRDYLQGEGEIATVAVSLDTSYTQWQSYIKQNELTEWLHSSELKRWKGDVVKRYNVYGTPTMFLLDKDKEIIGKPITVAQFRELFELRVKNNTVDK